MNKKQLEKNCVATFRQYGYNIVEVTNFESEEQEDGIVNCMLETICGYEEDVDDDLPDDEDSKIFWFDLIPNNGTYRIKNVHTA